MAAGSHSHRCNHRTYVIVALPSAVSDYLIPVDIHCRVASHVMAAVNLITESDTLPESRPKTELHQH